MGVRTEVTAAPSSDDLDVILKGLTAYNGAEVGPADRASLAVFIRDEQDRVIGGLSGYTSWGWLFTQLLFIPETLRGQGMAAKLLEQAEAEARRRGCRGAWIDTFNPQALKAYQRQGYEMFGELPAFVGDRTRTFLKKAL
ncbi:GNAT family N-acetyltransferase [Aliirhizobium smilacinae]|uniref:GNAT family N-acetyltransferase n=1 Tax=Aliirhizobium smilacinae TaxID=1395944 RepID=A0A5C4XHI0_9HYPH|nr:GNAT family N-acetyltransferase [Rhizobium smilacinae]TNM62973.1 GNAT family N-acetyltransferase [Rhizobium smilacinae]